MSISLETLGTSSNFYPFLGANIKLCYQLAHSQHVILKTCNYQDLHSDEEHQWCCWAPWKVHHSQQSQQNHHWHSPAHSSQHLKSLGHIKSSTKLSVLKAPWQLGNMDQRTQTDVLTDVAWQLLLKLVFSASIPMKLWRLKHAKQVSLCLG